MAWDLLFLGGSFAFRKGLSSPNEKQKRDARGRLGPSSAARRLIALAALVALIPGCGGQGPLDPTLDDEAPADADDTFAPEGTFVARRLLVKFRDEPQEREQGLLAAASARVSGEIPGIGVKIVELPEQASETALLRAFRQRPEVVHAELDLLLPPNEIPNDPYYANQWHLVSIAAPSAWDITTGSHEVIIAILDTGVNGAHADLASKMVGGWNFYENNADTSDVYGHGTPVAGAAAALGNNATGVASPAWGSRIMPLRISDPNGYATSSMVASALVWAADRGARVANISYAVTGGSTIDSAAQYFQSRGGVVVVSAGNSGTFVSAPDDPYLLTVSATDPGDAVPSWSTSGNHLDLAAPGVNVYTTTRSGGYGAGSGTSFSAPVVVGAAALVISANPNLTAWQVQDILKESADDFGPAGWDSQYGWGRVNAGRAVQAALSYTGDTAAPAVSISSPAGGAIVTGILTVQVSATDSAGVTSVNLYADGGFLGTDTASPYSFSWDTTLVANGTYTLRAVAMDAAANAGQAEITVTASNLLDLNPPAITITRPADGAQVNRNVSVRVNAGDDVAVVRVELYVDGVLTSSSTGAPFNTSWNTRRATAGAHRLQCRAYDAAGNEGRSQTITVYK